MKEIKISLFRELLKSKEIPYNVPLEKVFQRIKQGKSKELVQKIQNEVDKEIRSKLKQKLPCIVFAGVFSERNKNGLVEHSGLMVIDLDGFESKDEINIWFEKLKQNKHIVSVFISPSGNGLKGVVKIPKCDKYKHEQYFKAFNDAFKIPNWDKSNCNVDRVCFESYDPNIYVNWNAETFEPELIDKGFTVTEKVPLVPIDNESIIIDKIMKFNWSKDFVDGQRNNFIFDLAGAFCEYGISKETAEGYILNNVVIGNFSESETRTAISSAYKKRNFNTKYFEDYFKIERIKTDLKHGKKNVVEKYKIEESVFEEIKEVVENEDFWMISEKGKISVIPLKYKYFLERNGFKKHFPNESEKPQFVFVESNKVEVTSVSRIKDFVLDYLLEKKEIEVWNYCANYQNLFSETYLLMLESIDLFMLNDERDISYIAYNNGILEVKKDSKKLIDFIDIDGYIWKSHILNRNFKPLKNNDNDYKKFIFNISGCNPEPIECTIGYLMSTYKNRSNNKAVILNDEIISDNPEGGTGKGLFVQGISQIRNTSIIDGKQFDSKKSFAYQTVSLDVKVLVFDDVKKNFDFEDKFSLVTEGMTLERKNKDAIKLNIHESPKLLLSTNYAIKGEGNSHERRRHELEISQYYGKNLTPDDEFKRQLFDEWDDEEFLKFDNYMVYCLQLYLKKGLINQESKNINLRKFIAETSMDFYEWISDESNFPLNFRNDKATYFNNFVNDNKDYGNWLKRNKFNIWVHKYANYLNKKFDQNNSNGQKWFGIFDLNTMQTVTSEEDDFPY